MDEVKIQRICGRLVEQNIIHCCSSMVYELGRLDRFGGDDDFINLTRGRPDYETPCRDEGWVSFEELSGFAKRRALRNYGEDVTFVKYSDGCQEDGCDEPDWEALGCRERLDPEYSEIFEHWVVTPWFANKLQDHGEVIGELFDFTIWGRATTGQAILLDGVIREIANEMEILPGQKNEWKV